MSSPLITVTDLGTGTVQVVTGGFIGPQGPQGPSGGPQGAQGAQGADGAQGAVGAQGPQGTIGPQGPIGPQGGSGPQGAVGAQGAQGHVGPQGPQGVGGSTGPQGATGPQGTQGPAGVQGAQGAQGAGGSAGVQGAQGPQGNTGPQGAQGARGAAGPQGYQGAAGPQGFQGAKGPQGFQGTPGATGAQGPIGPQGVQGAQGGLGPQGALGPQGYQGDIGPQGAQGPAGGPQGPQGDPGNPGIVTVVHDTDGTVARPDNAPIVYWQGSAVPLNAASTDIWYGNTASQPQSFGSTLNFANAYTDAQITALQSVYTPNFNPSVGEFAPRRLYLNGTATLTSGTLVGPIIRADKTENIGTITAYTGSTAAGATPTTCAYGIFSIDPTTQNATLVAQSTNDTTLFAAANTLYAKALTGSFTKVAGTYYWIALLVVSGAAMPNFLGWQGPTGAQASTILNAWPAHNYALSGQSSIPSSVLGTSLTASATSVPIFRLS